MLRRSLFLFFLAIFLLIAVGGAWAGDPTGAVTLKADPGGGLCLGVIVRFFGDVHAGRVRLC